MWHCVSGSVFSDVWKDQIAFICNAVQYKKNDTTAIYLNVEEYSPDDTASRLGRIEVSETQLWEPRGFLQSYFNSSTNECVFEFIWTTKHNNNNYYNYNYITSFQRRKHRKYLLNICKISPSLCGKIFIQIGK
jgi:hypothetical protein